MIKNYKYRLFLKFGKKEHIEAFQKKGEICMNTLEDFRKLPEENLIGDKLEGIKFLKQLGQVDITLKIPNKNTLLLPNCVARMYPNDKIEGNIYCLYGADENILEKNYKSDHGILPLDSAFGSREYVAFIINPKEFIQRIINHLDATSLYYKYNPVEYLDYNRYEGKLNQFHKRIEYKNQNEFRIYVKNLINERLIFKIGDLSDICEIGLTKDHLNLKYLAM